jgi:epsilon-lactone hydrolase
MNNLLASMAMFVLSGGALISVATGATVGPSPTVDEEGTAHLGSTAVPLSGLESDEAKKNFLALVGAVKCESDDGSGDIVARRKKIDDCLMRPGVQKLRAVFAVDIRPDHIAGVPVDVIEPKGGESKRNKHRVLINLHGGGFLVAAGLGGQMESIPIASLGSFRVISVDYREGPEHQFPTASEDVASVYTALLKHYPPSNIGIYGCSAGGVLAAESMAWFQIHSLPKPGAIGIFGAGALMAFFGDSKYVAPAMMGLMPYPEDAKTSTPYFNVPGLAMTDPLVSPAYSPQVLSFFPPTLLISGTRDAGLSAAAYTHTQLVKERVDADLHVWEGASHCSFAQPIADPDVPETREAWDVIVKFFDKHLGR